MKRRAALLLIALLPGAALAASGLLSQPAGEPEFLPVDEAFQLQALERGGRGVVVGWRIAKDYYLYRDRMKFTLVSPTGTAVPVLPAGVPHHDEHFGTVTVYRGDLAVPLTLSQAAAKGPVKLTVVYQGCADSGLCYPPQTRTLDLAE